MFKFNNSIVPNKVRIGWHFSSNKYSSRDAYLALKSSLKNMIFCQKDLTRLPSRQRPRWQVDKEAIGF